MTINIVTGNEKNNNTPNASDIISQETQNFTTQVTEITENKKLTFDEKYEVLDEKLKNLVPAANIDYYKNTDTMHCDTTKPGGSKFLEIGSILEVLDKGIEKINLGLQTRNDDREEMIKIGVSQKAFLPAVKDENAPQDLPEALYFKIDGIKGKLGIIQLKELSPNTKIIIRREKSLKDDNGIEKVNCSYSTVLKDINSMPDVDYATVIIGREGGENGANEIWTIHPGAPIRSSEGDFIPGSENLNGPIQGEKQGIIIISVKDLLSSGKMNNDDYVKVILGDENEIINQYEVVK